MSIIESWLLWVFAEIKFIFSRLNGYVIIGISRIKVLSLLIDCELSSLLVVFFAKALSLNFVKFVCFWFDLPILRFYMIFGRRILFRIIGWLSRSDKIISMFLVVVLYFLKLNLVDVSSVKYIEHVPHLNLID